jgi:two-component system response regulator
MPSRTIVPVEDNRSDEQDLATGYDLGVNSYIPKALDFKQFTTAIEQLDLCWLSMNEPPPPTSEPRASASGPTDATP